MGDVFKVLIVAQRNIVGRSQLLFDTHTVVCQSLQETAPTVASKLPKAYLIAGKAVPNQSFNKFPIYPSLPLPDLFCL